LPQVIVAEVMNFRCAVTAMTGTHSGVSIKLIILIMPS